jgi:two-component system, cell cycle sensor histidine kinase PleC
MAAEHDPFPQALSLAVHEFRSPVTVFSGYLRMVLKGQAGPLTDKQRKMLEEAERSCARMSVLVEEMSDLGKLSANKLAISRQNFDLSDIVRDAASREHEGADRGVTLDVRAADRPVLVNGDRARLSATIGVLMRAALRERGDPGVIVAECSAAADDNPPWAILAIGDAALLPQLTASRTNPPGFDEWRGGLGLALPIARRLIEAHGGAIWSAAGSESRAAAALRLPLQV